MDCELTAQRVRGSEDGEWKRIDGGGVDEGGLEGGGSEGGQEKANY